VITEAEKIGENISKRETLILAVVRYRLCELARELWLLAVVRYRLCELARELWLFAVVRCRLCELARELWLLAVVRCRLCELARELWLLAVSVCEFPIYPNISPNAVYSYNHMQLFLKQCSVAGTTEVNYLFNPGQPRTLLQLKLVGILSINLFLT
jgi:hypothetical protein